MPNKLCWDSCLFIDMLSAEPQSADRRSQLEDVLEAVDRKLAILVTSTLVATEVLDIIDDPLKRKNFERVMDLPSVFCQPVTMPIAKLAGRIRQSLRPKYKLKSMDALFIATAINQECDVLHTYDDQLLRLSGRQEVRYLKIATPGVAQASFDFD